MIHTDCVISQLGRMVWFFESKGAMEGRAVCNLL